MGELRIYGGSSLLKLVARLSIYIFRKAHIKVAEDLYHEIEGTERKLIMKPIKEGDMGELCLRGNINLLIVA